MTSPVEVLAERLLDADHALTQAAYADDAARAYPKAQAIYGGLMVRGASLGLPYVTSPADGWRAARAPIIERTIRRRVMMVTHHDHRRLGSLHRLYVSGNREDETREWTHLWVAAEQHGALRLVATAVMCWECEGAGRSGAGAPCSDCEQLGFTPCTGLVLTEWGQRVGVTQLVRPRPQRQRLHFDMMRPERAGGKPSP